MAIKRLLAVEESSNKERIVKNLNEKTTSMAELGPHVIALGYYVYSTSDITVLNLLKKHLDFKITCIVTDAKWITPAKFTTCALWKSRFTTKGHGAKR